MDKRLNQRRTVGLVLREFEHARHGRDHHEGAPHPHQRPEDAGCHACVFHLM